MSTAESTPKYQDSEWLWRKYVKEGLTQEEIGEVCNVSSVTICRWMVRHGIDTRTDSGRRPSDSRVKDEEWLRSKYQDEMCSIEDIAEICGVGYGTVARYMDTFGIERRSESEKITEESKRKLSEFRTGMRYSEETRQKMSEAHTTNETPVSTTWRTTGRWRQTRKRVIQQDGEECALCGKSRVENFENSGRDLHVHHIIPVVEGGEKFSECNLITLCQECHINEHK